MPVCITGSMLRRLRLHPAKVFFNEGRHLGRKAGGRATDIGDVLRDAMRSQGALEKTSSRRNIFVGEIAVAHKREEAPAVGCDRVVVVALNDMVLAGEVAQVVQDVWKRVDYGL
jgi:hypothetical protein